MRKGPESAGVRSRQIRRRPKDRRAVIARTAAKVFSGQGYHAASMNDIAARVGISGPALYRHYPNKYDMFAATVSGVVERLTDRTEFVDALSDSEIAADPGALQTRVIHALIDATMTDRDTSQLYRWHARFLEPGDLSRLTGQLQVVSRRIERPLGMLRPALTAVERRMLSTAAFSVIGSIADHDVTLPAGAMRATLAAAASATLAAPLPGPRDQLHGNLLHWSDVTPEDGAAGAILRNAIALFARQGYAQTTMAQIGEAARIPTSSLYGYFSGKPEILAVALRRAGELVAGETSGSVEDAERPRQSLSSLIDTYVAVLFAIPEVPVLYFVERAHLPPSEQQYLRDVQLSMIDSWTKLLNSARPDLDAAQARALVHAARTVVIDLLRLFDYERSLDEGSMIGASPREQAGVQVLAKATLFGV